MDNRTMGRRGNMLVLFLPFVFGLFGFSLLAWDVGQWALTAHRAQTAADAVLLSSLRIRAESLQTVAERWGEFGDAYVEGYSGGEVFVPSDLWSDVQRRADALRRAISGYKGRITSVLRVVMEANGFPYEAMTPVRDDAQQLGIVAEPVILRDENGRTRTIQGGWYRRLWAPLEQAPQPPEESILQVHLSIPLIGSGFAGESTQNWVVQEQTTAQLCWDVDPENSEVRRRGNGGFPRDWDQALEENQVQPHRFSLYDAEVRVQPEEAE